MDRKQQTYISPSFSPIPGSASTRPHFAVLIRCRAAFHLHLTPRKGSNFRGRHHKVETRSGKRIFNTEHQANICRTSIKPENSVLAPRSWEGNATTDFIQTWFCDNRIELRIRRFAELPVLSGILCRIWGKSFHMLNLCKYWVLNF